MHKPAAPGRVPDNLRIPTLPSIVQRINQLIDDPEAGTREIGAVVATDAPLAAKILRIVNSAYFGLREPCVSAEHASAVLGMRGLRNAITQAVVFRQFEHLKATGFDLDELWRHSVLTAQACAMLARKSRAADLTPDELYTCGLLHDIGKVVMLDTVGTEYMAVVRTAERQGIPMVQAERLQLGYDHTDIGAIIATCWSLPIPVAAAIEFHHGPPEAVEGSEVVALVAAANRIVHRVAEGDAEGAGREVDAPTASLLGLASKDVADVVASLADQQALVEV